MRPSFALAVLATLAMDVAAKQCKLIGSGTVVCRSCPSKNCDNMGNMDPGDYVNVSCMCHGQMQDGVDSWLYVPKEKCYIRQPRTNCCENCMDMCNHCPCKGNDCGGCGGGGCDRV